MKHPLNKLTVALGMLTTMLATASADLVGHWTFEDGETLEDLAGNFPDLSLEGDATVSGGALDVNGAGTAASGWAYTTGDPYSGPDLSNKTLVSWVTVQSPSTTTAAGSALTLDRTSGDQFDGIIFAERDMNRWMNGSNGFSRTPDTEFADGVETEIGTGVIVQMAISYEDTGGGNVRITGYRDGVQIGQYDDNPLGIWNSGDAEVIFGKRHGNPPATGPGAVDALIHEARIYDTVLTQQEIGALQLTISEDSDEDGLPDQWEEEVIDSDPDDAYETLADINPGDDLDNDNLTNMEEFAPPRTDPLDADSDDDNLNDDVETNTGTYVDATDTGTNPTDPDTDGDGLQDGVETNTGNFVSATNTGTDPNNENTDGDRLSDGDEVAEPFSDPNNPADPPAPPLEDTLLGHWTFEDGEELTDLIGNWPDLSLEGDAQIVDAGGGKALDVNGNGTTASGWAYTTGGDGYTGPEIREKTLVAWVTLQSLRSGAPSVYAGSAITIDKVGSDLFDGIIFAERQADNRWMNGSSFFGRSGQDWVPGFAETEVGDPDGDPIKMAITYEELEGGQVRVTGYREIEGVEPQVQIGQSTYGAIAVWPTGDAEIIFGKRHGNPATSGPGALDALIHEARIYGQAGTPQQIAELTLGAGTPLKFTDVVAEEDEVTGELSVTVTWVSKVGKTYVVEWSTAMEFWVEEDDSIPAGGAASDRTTYTFEGIPAGTTERFFRVKEQ